jgi:hypothetical protein
VAYLFVFSHRSLFSEITEDRVWEYEHAESQLAIFSYLFPLIWYTHGGNSSWYYAPFFVIHFENISTAPKKQNKK